jgi:Asp-tRNA(Asn)/Glu-tRNA(Gln) amidotransferase A subunit family amidase
MTRTFFFCICCLFCCRLAAQKISPQQVAGVEPLLDLTFTEAERDSMLVELDDQLALYKIIHAAHIDNWIAPPLYFDPVAQLKSPPRPTKKAPARFDIPKNVNLPQNRSELAFYTIPQLASLVKSRKITAVELTQFFLNRLKTYGDTLHCVVSLTEDIALREARQADEEIKKGQYRGILHGIPYGIKDLLAVEGTKTTWGAAPFKNQTIDQTATVVKKLRAAGAVLVAKLSLGSLAMGDVWYGGKTRSPWNLKRGSSGSSAGSASATVAGLVPFAIGSETLGSIVSPSNACGATGLRPTFGAVSRYGAMTLCWSLDKLGPICRSTEDAAIVFETIRGVDALDPSTRAGNFAYDARTDWKKLRIGYPKNLMDTLPRTHPDWQVIRTLEQLGATVRPFEFRPSVSFQIVSVILMSECAAAFDELTRSNLDDQLTQQHKNAWPNYFRAARLIPAVEYLNANRLRKLLIDETDALLRQYDVAIMPTFMGGQLQTTNLTGHPALVMPTGFGKDNRPTSITFIGNYFDEAAILAVGKAYEMAAGVVNRHPEVFWAGK